MRRRVLIVILVIAAVSFYYVATKNSTGAARSSSSSALDPFEYEMLTAPPGEFTLHIPVTNSYQVAFLPKRIHFKDSFSIGKYEVSNEQWNVCYKMGGCSHAAVLLDGETGENPVVRVNWHDAYQFTRWLSGVTKHAYRLPLEEEWVYAAYMGVEHKDSEVEYDYSDLKKISSIVKVTNPRGSFPANRWGMADISGNVWEWTLTCWFGSDENTLKARTVQELNTPSACSTRIAQGEHRSHIPDFVSDTYSGGCSTLRPAANLGFRLVRDG